MASPLLPCRRAGPRPARIPLLAPLITAVALLALVARPLAQGVQVPPHFEVVTLPGAYILPVGLTFAPDGMIWLIEKPGTVRVLSDQGVQQALPFLNLTAEVNNDGDRGLLGIALHPGFVPDGGANSWVYLLYTVSPTAPLDNPFNGGGKYSFSRLTRWRAVPSGGSVVADLGSRQVLLGNQLPDGSVPDGIASLHNSHSNGSLRFADDGTLLLVTGDGAHYDFQDNGGADNAGFDDVIHPGTGLKGPTPKVQDAGAFRALDPRSLAGKLLRLDPETGLGLPSNPFWDGSGASNASRVYALGLRNPFRMDLVPGTGSSNPADGQPNVVLLGDVGWNIWEELNVAAAPGRNFGWPCFEGLPAQGGYQGHVSGNPDQVTCQTTPWGLLTGPALVWHHSNNALVSPAGVHVTIAGQPGGGFRGNCAIGGPVYTGGSYPAEFEGRMFVSDYGRAWIKTVRFSPGWQVLEVQDFAEQTGQVVAMERHPLTGDLYLCNLSGGVIQRIGFGANLTPLALATANPTLGLAPLAVQFTGSGSTDPEDDELSFAWDFDDGSPVSTLPDPVHVFAADGLYDVTLEVTDELGLSSLDVIQIAVGNGPPVATILAPLHGDWFSVPTTLDLLGQGTDPEGEDLDYDWTIDLHHATHVHPGSFLASGAAAAFDIGVSPEDDELLYYRIQLSVTDGGGLSDSAEVWVYPLANRRDVAGTGLPLSAVDLLVPAGPTGGGNHDIEVVRDGLLPAVGNGDSAVQYDTYHGGDQGSDDWIGYALAAPPGDEFRFVEVQFQEGKHFVDGGWWENLAVEVRQGGTWTPAPGVTIDPPYPFALAGQAFFDGLNFESYALRFPPIAGDAIRLRGNPGGSAGFISVGELRAFGMEGVTSDGHADITADGSIVAKIFELSPPVPLGGGNPDPATIANGTWPPVGSSSFHAQFDSFHTQPKNGEDWIGYVFPGQRTFSRLRFQEGRNNADGGAFSGPAVQVQATPGGPWTAVPGVTVTPPYDGLDGVHYETFAFSFPPVAGHGLRLHGAPAGSSRFISVGELAVDSPDPPGGCGWLSYGLPGGANTLQLHSHTPPLLGFPIEVEGHGASGPAAGWLGLSLGEAALPLKGGTLHLDPATLLLLPVAWDRQGEVVVPATLPGDPVWVGLSAWLQAFAAGQPGPHAIRMSNGLRLTVCDA